MYTWAVVRLHLLQRKHKHKRKHKEKEKTLILVLALAHQGRFHGEVRITVCRPQVTSLVTRQNKDKKD